jgi:hypothetical protein
MTPMTKANRTKPLPSTEHSRDWRRTIFVLPLIFVATITFGSVWAVPGFISQFDNSRFRFVWSELEPEPTAMAPSRLEIELIPFGSGTVPVIRNSIVEEADDRTPTGEADEEISSASSSLDRARAENISVQLSLRLMVFAFLLASFASIALSRWAAQEIIRKKDPAASLRGNQWWRFWVLVGLLIGGSWSGGTPWVAS